MVDTVFRTKIEPQKTEVEATVEKADPVVISENKEKEMSPELWSNTNNKPYLAKLLNLENIYDDLAPEILSDIDAIENYFKELVRSGKRSNNKVSYQDFISYFEKIVDAKNQPIIQKLNKIAEFIKTIKRAKEYVKSI